MATVKLNFSAVCSQKLKLSTVDKSLILCYYALLFFTFRPYGREHPQHIPKRRRMFPEKKFHEYAITGGPNKMDLMLAVFDPHPGGERDTYRVVTFKITVAGQSEDVNAIVEGAERKNGGADYWSFKGYAPSCPHGMNCEFEGNFDTQGRHGIIKFRKY